MKGKQQKCGGGGGGGGKTTEMWWRWWSIVSLFTKLSLKKVECRVDVGWMRGRCGVDVGSMGSMWGRCRVDVVSIGGRCICGWKNI